MLYLSIEEKFDELKNAIGLLDENQYSGPSKVLNGTSIGEHVRHIIELFQCLTIQYHLGVICYDKRERNKRVETERAFAIQCINNLSNTIQQSDKPLLLVQELEEKECQFNTTYERELLYNLEHCIHHQALIKIALMHFPDISVPEHFGVAPSTMRHRKSLSSAPGQ